MNDFPDQLLVEHVLQGEIACFEVLCKRYYTSLQAVAYAVLMDEQLAEDAAQETLAYACRNFSKLRKPEKVGSWLAAICRNVAKDMHREQDQSRCLAPDEPTFVLREDDDSGKHIRRAVAQLPTSLREVVMMRYFDDLSYQQMGNILGLSEQAINGRLRRAKKKMEKYLNQNGFRRNDL